MEILSIDFTVCSSKLQRNDSHRILVDANSGLLPMLLKNGTYKATYHSGRIRILKVILVYYNDLNIDRNEKTISLLQCFVIKIITLSFIGFVTMLLILFCLRQLTRSHRRCFILTLMDMTIVYFGGGTLRIIRSWERIFFGAALLGTLTLQSMGFLSVLYNTFLFANVNRIDTFEQLKKLNVTLAMHTPLESYAKTVKLMIEYEIIVCILNLNKNVFYFFVY